MAAACTGPSRSRHRPPSERAAGGGYATSRVQLSASASRPRVHALAAQGGVLRSTSTTHLQGVREVPEGASGSARAPRRPKGKRRSSRSPPRHRHPRGHLVRRRRRSAADFQVTDGGDPPVTSQRERQPTPTTPELRPRPRPRRAAEVGAHLRRGRDPAGRRRVGRARGVPVAGDRGGRQDRPLLPRLLRHPELRRDRARAAGRRWRSCSGATPASAWRSSAPPSPRPASSANGTPEQIGEWVPQMFGSPGDLKIAAFCSSEPDAGSDVGAMRTRATYDEAKRRVGPQRHQDLGDQRRDRRRARRHRGRSTPSCGPAARPASWSRPAPRG